MCKGMAWPTHWDGGTASWAGGTASRAMGSLPWGEVHEGVGVISDGVDTVGGHRTWRR